MRINVLILLMYLSSLNCIAQFPIIYKSDSVYCTLFYGDKENQLVVFDNDKDTSYDSYFDTEVKIWKGKHSDIKRRVRRDNRFGWSVYDGKVNQFSLVSIDTTFRYACNPHRRYHSEKLQTSFEGLELNRLGETFPTRYGHNIPISFKCHERVVSDTLMTDSSYFNYWKDSAFVDIMNCGGYVLKVFQQVSSRGLQEYIEYGPNGYSSLDYIKSAKENGKYAIISVDSLWLVNGPFSHQFYSFQNAYKIPYANHFKAFYIDNCNYILNDSLEVYKLDLSKNHILDSEDFDNFYDGPKEKIKRKIIPAEKVGYFDLSSKEDYFL